MESERHQPRWNSTESKWNLSKSWIKLWIAINIELMLRKGRLSSALKALMMEYWTVLDISQPSSHFPLSISSLFRFECEFSTYSYCWISFSRMDGKFERNFPFLILLSLKGYRNNKFVIKKIRSNPQKVEIFSFEDGRKLNDGLSAVWQLQFPNLWWNSIKLK